MVAYVVEPAGEIREIDVSGEDALEDMQHAVGGFLKKLVLGRTVDNLTLQNDGQKVTVKNPVFFVNEEGLRLQLPTNLFITYIFTSRVVGPVLVVPADEVP